MTRTKSVIIIFLFSFFAFKSQLKAQCDLSDNSTVAVTGITSIDVNCPQNGTLTVNGVSGGGGSYVYELSNGPIIRGIQSQNVFPALLPGNYTVRVTGCNGTFIEKPAVVGNSYLEPSLQAMSFIADSSFKCNNLNSGTVKLTVLLSFPNGLFSDTQFYRLPLRYQVSTNADPATGFSSSAYNYFHSDITYIGNEDSRRGVAFYKLDTIKGLAAGTTYYVRVTDQCGVFKTTSITIPNINTSVFTYDFSVKEPYILNSNSTDYPAVKSSCVQWGELTILSDGSPVSSISSTNTLAPITAVLKRQDNGAVIDTRKFGAGGLSKYSSYGYSSSGINNLLFDSVPRVPVTLELTDQCGNITSINANTPSVKTPFMLSASTACNNGDSYFYINTKNAAPSLPVRLKIYDNSNALLVDKVMTINYQYVFITGATGFSDGQSSYVPGFGEYRIVYEDQCNISDSIVFNFQPPSLSPEPAYNFISYAIACTQPGQPAMFNVDAVLTNSSAINQVEIISGPPGLTYPRILKYISVLTNRGAYSYSYNSKTTFDSLLAGTYHVKVSYGCSQVFTCTFKVAGGNTGSASGTMSFAVESNLCNTSGNTVSGNFVLTGDINLLISDPPSIRIIAAPLEFLKKISYSKDGSDPVLPYNLGAISANSRFDNGIDTSGLMVYPVYSFLSLTSNFFKFPAGDYTFQMYGKCTGTILDTQSFSVTSAGYSKPNLGASSGYICDAGEIKVIASPIGGKPSFLYQIKLTSDPDESHYSNLQSDSVFVLPANTPPGTVYTLRTVDACNNSFVGEVVVNSFTGKLYIAASDDCLGSPSRIITGYIPGATYTWTKPDGTVIVTNSNELHIATFSISDIGTYSVVANALDGCITRSASLAVGGRCYIVLPIDILNFTATKKNENAVDLNWETGNETYSNTFEIERSSDGDKWIKVGQQTARLSGGSTKETYTFHDIIPQGMKAVVIYYRIKQVDANGKINYTTVKKVYFSTAFTVLKVYPTPFVSAVSIDFISESKQSAVVSLFDMQGKEVSRFVMPVNKGINHYQYAPVLSIEAGNYILSFTQGTNAFTQQVTKMNK